MGDLAIFDVLVVYTESMALSANALKSSETRPFPKNSGCEGYNDVYGYFLETCKKFHLSAALSTSADVVEAGRCQSFWTYEKKQWVRHEVTCFSNLIFDKFSPTRKRIKRRREILFSDADIKPFNDPELFELFFDKQLTHDELADYAIPTVSIEGKTKAEVEKAMKILVEKIGKRQDRASFGEGYVLKDRFGAGGRHVHKFGSHQSERIAKLVRHNPRTSFILQPFVCFDRGFVYEGDFASTDIRMIFLDGQIIQSYIRRAKQGDFRCNEHQGGSLTYVDLADLPSHLIARAETVAKEINKTSLFALDFIISNSGEVYLLEGNTGPGLDWNPKIKKNVIEAKRLIWLIAQNLAMRVATKPVEAQGVMPFLVPVITKVSFV